MLNIAKKGYEYLIKVAQKGFFHLLSVNFFTQFLAFGTALIVAKFLTPVELGEIKIIQSYSGFFVVIAGFGLNSAILKVCSENRSEDEKRVILRRSLAITILSTFVTLTILAGLSLSGILTSTGYLAIWLIIYSLSIPFIVATDILSSYLQALKKIKNLAILRAIIKIQTFVVIVFCTWRWGFKAFIVATVIAFAIGLVPLMFHIFTGSINKSFETPTNIFRTFSSAILPIGFYHIAIFSMLANAVGIIGQYGDIYILDHFAYNRTDIGLYSLALTFIIAAQQVTATVQMISFPYFSARSHDWVWFRRKLVQTQLRLAGISVIVAVGVFFIAWAAIHTIYGSSYLPTLTYLGILLIRYIIWSSCAVVGIALFALGFIRYNLITSIISTIIGLTCSYIFLQRYSITGVAFAQVISGVVLFALTMMFIWLVSKRKIVRSSIEVPL